MLFSQVLVPEVSLLLLPPSFVKQFFILPFSSERVDGRYVCRLGLVSVLYVPSWRRLV